MDVLSILAIAAVIFGFGAIAGICLALWLMEWREDQRRFYVPDYPPDDLIPRGGGAKETTP